MEFSSWNAIQEINKGWSTDRKYQVTDADGVYYLLRISPLDQYEAKKTEFFYMQRLASLAVPMCLPLEFGVCKEGIYSLQSWISGIDLEDALPSFTSAESRALGVEAGKILRVIHSIPAPENQENWASRFNRKIDRKIQFYTECSQKYEGGESFLRCIEETRDLLCGRPQCYQHGDYHSGNMMLQNRQLFIIDFNRSDFGDPWEEFNRIVWCAQLSPIFATGMVDGYFDSKPPMEFWCLLMLYIASNTLSSLLWAIPFGEKEIDTMRRQASDILYWYDGMTNPVPRWYKREY